MAAKGAETLGQQIHEIRICMGSSCFARGNRQNLALIQQFLGAWGAAGQVSLAGNLCEGRCAEGPILVADGRVYTRVVPERLEVILREVLGCDGEPPAEDAPPAPAEAEAEAEAAVRQWRGSD